MKFEKYLFIPCHMFNIREGYLRSNKELWLKQHSQRFGQDKYLSGHDVEMARLKQGPIAP